MEILTVIPESYKNQVQSWSDGVNLVEVINIQVVTGFWWWKKIFTVTARKESQQGDCWRFYLGKKRISHKDAVIDKLVKEQVYGKRGPRFNQSTSTVIDSLFNPL